MRRSRRLLAGLLLAGLLGLAGSGPVAAGYGNHAERATANIQTRIAIGKANLLYQVNQFKPVQARGGLPQP
jgi:hypothetical protein